MGYGTCPFQIHDIDIHEMIYLDIYIYIYIYDGLPKCLFLVLLINRNSLRAASYCAFKTMTDLNFK